MACLRSQECVQHNSQLIQRIDAAQWLADAEPFARRALRHPLRQPGQCPIRQLTEQQRLTISLLCFANNDFLSSQGMPRIHNLNPWLKWSII
jgi:hypothetical protein